ncbi:DUF6484 domain-containing protein [Paraliomyxa miuraensis]|uniref:DUF6484 domain-containing protein n=1 Tax=Paraliomyxa miuraensis TaxID=376150 RepID=UPI00224EF4D6|nr:DUF6484 domain-containing protein [Paraliomyxa miuraensis]MCX4240137.1 DUF6484 domain-containing protein [Paraliomyxa miuraensis]
MNAESPEDPNAARESDPSLQFEPLMGTVVAVSQDGEVVVKLVAPNGQCLRAKALATIPIEPGMVGQPVELTFIEGHLDRPVITRLVDLRAELRAQWDALGRKVLAIDADPRKLAELLRETRALVCTAAILDAVGNVTYGAKNVGMSRKSVRQYVDRWKRNNPRLAPVLEALVGRQRASRTKMRSTRVEGARARDQRRAGGDVTGAPSVHEADCAANRSRPGSHEEGTR